MSAQPALSVVSDAKAPDPPYAATTLAKGWRFELDSERIRRSDTWALTPPELRPWLLMLWMTAWDQAPCGSLPANDELIAAHAGMDLRQFRANRDLLMRGWRLASDGRLYHDVIAEQVVALIALREEEAARKQRYREKLTNSKNQQHTQNVPRDSIGTPAGATLPEPEPEPEPDNTLTPSTVTSTPKNTSPSKKPRAKKSALDVFPAPDGVMAENWGRYLGGLTKRMKPERYATLCEDLQAMQAKGIDVDAAVRQSVSNGWLGIFPPKGDQRAPPRYESVRDEASRRYWEQANAMRAKQGGQDGRDDGVIDGTAQRVTDGVD